MATTVALPAVRRGDLGENRRLAFQAIEHRFAWQARTAIVVVGLTRVYMIWRLDLWDRFRTASFRWMHAMVCLWLLFAFILFIAEPFILHRHFQRGPWRGRRHFAWLHRAHWGAAGVECGDDPGRSRGEPRMVDLLRRGRGRSMRPTDSLGRDQRGAKREMKR